MKKEYYCDLVLDTENATWILTWYDENNKVITFQNNYLKTLYGSFYLKDKFKNEIKEYIKLNKCYTKKLKRITSTTSDTHFNKNVNILLNYLSDEFSLMHLVNKILKDRKILIKDEYDRIGMIIIVLFDIFTNVLETFFDNQFSNTHEMSMFIESRLNSINYNFIFIKEELKDLISDNYIDERNIFLNSLMDEHFGNERKLK